jgi:uncharacterized membrane protein YphA (DoxX/SURF4 family)
MDETGDSSVLLVARCLLAGLFLWSGIGKINGYDEIGMLTEEHGAMACCGRSRSSSSWPAPYC